MTVLHATEPATPYLSLFARIDSFTQADLERALFESKSLVKQLAMRRTLFVFPRDLLPAAVSGPPPGGTVGSSERTCRTMPGGLS